MIIAFASVADTTAIVRATKEVINSKKYIGRITTIPNVNFIHPHIKSSKLTTTSLGSFAYFL